MSHLQRREGRYLAAGPSTRLVNPFVVPPGTFSGHGKDSEVMVSTFHDHYCKMKQHGLFDFYLRQPKNENRAGLPVAVIDLLQLSPEDLSLYVAKAQMIKRCFCFTLKRSCKDVDAVELLSARRADTEFKCDCPSCARRSQADSVRA